MSSHGASTARSEGLARGVATCALALAAWCGSAARAEQSGPAPDVSTLDRVVVTGTHIAQIEIEGALPVQVIRREEIERSGVTTVEQLLERVPANVNPVNAALTVGEPRRPGL